MDSSLDMETTGKRSAVNGTAGQDPEPARFIADPLPRPATGTTMPPKGADLGPRAATSPTIQRLAERLAVGEAGALDEFWAALAAAGSPLVEDAPGSENERIVTFVARETDPDVEVVLFANRVTDPEFYDRSVLRALPGTDLRYLSLLARDEWRCQYTLGRAPGAPTPRGLEMVERSIAAGSQVPRETLLRWWGAQGNAAADPFHQRAGRWAESVIAGSWVELPAALPAPVLTRLPDASARLQRLEFASEALGGSRTVWVYTPPAIDESARREPGLLVLTDGEEWARAGVIAALLDGPIAAGELPPLTVVMVAAGDPWRRASDLACSSAFVDALHEELLPALVDGRERFAPERTILGGASLGGLTAAYAAMRLPRRFGLAYSQSGSFWWPTVRSAREEPAWLNRCFAALPRLPLRFRLEAGLHERVLLGATRHLRDVLVAKGYELSYEEVDGGHDRLWWAASLPRGLAALTHDW